MYLPQSAPVSCFLLVLLASAAVATRQLEFDSAAQQLQEGPAPLVNITAASYKLALADSSCHGFLIGIGTQKGELQAVSYAVTCWKQSASDTLPITSSSVQLHQCQQQVCAQLWLC
jgi:hypothetical protein